MVERRKKSLLTPLEMALMSTTRLIQLVTTLGKTMHLGVMTASQPRGERKTGTLDGTASISIAKPAPRNNDGRSAIVNTNTMASGGIETTNRGVVKGIAMIDIAVATTAASDTGVVTGSEVATETEVDGMMTATTDTTTTRIPITLPDARREAAPGHGKIQSHTRVETTLLVTTQKPRQVNCFLLITF